MSSWLDILNSFISYHFHCFLSRGQSLTGFSLTRSRKRKKQNATTPRIATKSRLHGPMHSPNDIRHHSQAFPLSLAFNLFVSHIIKLQSYNTSQLFLHYLTHVPNELDKELFARSTKQRGHACECEHNNQAKKICKLDRP